MPRTSTVFLPEKQKPPLLGTCVGAGAGASKKLRVGRRFVGAYVVATVGSITGAATGAVIKEKGKGVGVPEVLVGAGVSAKVIAGCNKNRKLKLSSRPICPETCRPLD